MKCPCGCGQEVPNGRFFATRKCSKRGNKMGIRMPNRRSEFERKMRRERDLKWRLSHGR